MDKKTVLVTGACGFIGSHLVARLLQLQYPVHILVRKNSNFWRIKNIIRHLKVHQINFLSKKQLATKLKKINPTIIFHLASFGGYPWQADVQTILKANLDTSLNLLRAASNLNYTLFVNTGSSSEYGIKDKPMKETDALAPVSMYGATKSAVTLLACALAAFYNKNIVTIRPFSVYGPYEEASRLIPQVIIKCLRGEKILAVGSDEARDFIYIDDFIAGYLSLMGAENVAGKVINLGSGKQTKVREVIKLVHTLTNSKSDIVWGGYQPRAWDTNHWVADTALAQKLLHFNPRYTLRAGLTKTISWFKKNLDLYQNLN